MMKIKKCLTLILSALIVLCIGCFVGCGNNGSSSSQPKPQQTVTPTITLEKTNIQLNRGEKTTLTYTLKDLEGTPSWYSFNPNVAEVDAVSGEITAGETGQTTIVASIGNYSASCEVLVSEKAVEVKEFKVELSSTEIVLNADSQYSSVQITATAIYDGMPVQTEITFESSDSSKVSVEKSGNVATIRALVNGSSVMVTSTATYQGVTVSSVCYVTCQGSCDVVFNQEQIKLFPNESVSVDYDLYVDGQKNNDKKVDVTYSAKDESVISIDENGLVNAVKKGQTQVVLTYGGREFYIDVVVGEVVYVNSAEQFMEVEGQSDYVKYVLQNDIDLSGYFKQNPSINKTALIENFGGVIDGAGYTVSGYHRLKNADDTGFNGIFGILGGDAQITNLGVKITVDTDLKVSVIANNSSAVIKNCVFDFTVNGKGENKAVIFNTNNGKVENVIVKVNGQANLGVADSGIGSYANVSVIASKLTYGAPNGIMINNNFTDCYYYESQNNFANKNGSVLDGNGVGASATFDGDNYDKETFVVDEINYLKNAGQTKPYVYGEVPVYAYDVANVGEQVQIQLPTATEGQTITFKVLDYTFSDVTEETIKEGKFKATKTGNYYVIVYSFEKDVYSYSTSTITVENVVPEINATRVLLGKGTNEFTLTVEGKQASDYNYFSSNEKVATVSDTGVITAITQGTSTVRVAEKNGQSSYTVLVTVINDYTEVSDYEGLVNALTTAIKGDYVVLTADINIDETPIRILKDADGNDRVHTDGTPIPHAVVIDCFKGILDGQGYRINLNFESDTVDVLMCGLFYSIEVGAEVRNLYYNFNANYVPTSKYATYNSTFVRNCSGIIRSCYLESNLNPTVPTGGMEGIIGYLSNQLAATPTAYVYDTIFKLETKVDGVIQDGGHAIRAGTRNPYGYDNALIRNGSNNEFYGTCSFTSALEGSGNIKYNTLYDFVNGRNGYFKSVLSVITKVSDGDVVYADWGGEWTIGKEEIKLCGRKVTDVKFEEYNLESGIAIDDNRGVLSWAKEIGRVDIYINGELKLTQNTNTFDAYNYISKNYDPFVGEYKIIVDNGARTGAVLYQIIELNSDNFVSTLRKINTKDSAMYKYFVFGSDIMLNSWVGNDQGDFVARADQAGGYYVFNQLYGNVDARGYSLNAVVNTTATTFGGFIGNNRCNWQNLVFNLDATYGATAYGLLTANSWGGCFENCYINIKATSVDSKGNVVPDVKTSVVYTPRNCNYINCIMVVKQTEGSSIKYFADVIGSKPHFENIIFIRNAPTTDIILSQSSSWMSRQFINCYYYTNLTEFAKGGKGALIDVPSGVEFSAKSIEGEISYKEFDGVWEINDKEVRLFDRRIILIVETGDNFVNDEDIVG